MSAIKHIDDNQFETEVLQSKGLVLVDFSATWCGPCQRQLPILENFAETNNSLVKVCAVDIDDAPNTVSKLGIRSVPTILMFQDGQQTGMKVGLTSLAELNILMIKNA